MSEQQQSISSQQQLAAIDLGSNSFHLVLARVANGEVQILEKRGEKVQLAEGLSARSGLTQEAQERALACLERFAQRIRGMESANVSILGTNALRAAKNATAFVEKAETVLGYPVNIIAGREEARLIYLGAANTLADNGGNRLVVDIGGGSTEFIIGQGFEPIELESLHMGCVAFNDRFFSDGKLSDSAFRKAVNAARQEVTSISAQYKKRGWKTAIGCSGTIRAASRAIAEAGLGEDNITLPGLYRIRDLVLTQKTQAELNIPGVKADRIRVFPAGLAILIGLFEELGIERMVYSDGALREGALYELLGSDNAAADVRQRTISAMQARYMVDTEQASRVAASAERLLNQVKKSWGLEKKEYAHWLHWASQLFEAGLAISHTQFHKHGGYLIQHGDLLGFSRTAQQAIATLVRGHRRKFPLDELALLPKTQQQILSNLLVIFRLAVTLHHSRGAHQVAEPAVTADKKDIRLDFPAGWLEAHPMSILDFEAEQGFLRAAGYELAFA